MRFIGCTPNTITLAANGALDKASAQAVGSYIIEGVKIAKAEVSPHGTSMRLTGQSAWPWKDGDAVVVKFNGLKTLGGAAVEGEAAFKYLSGRVHGGEGLREFLLGDVVEKVEPKKAVELPIADEATLKPAGGGGRLETRAGNESGRDI